jgi:hypothetical protein
MWKDKGQMNKKAKDAGINVKRGGRARRVFGEGESYGFWTQGYNHIMV